MRNRHQEPLENSVMLRHASQTSWLMQNVRDKYQNLPDPDTFAFDNLWHLLAGKSKPLNFAEEFVAAKQIRIAKASR